MSEEYVLCVDVGGSGAKLSTVGADGTGGRTSVALPVHRAGHRVEFDPCLWWGVLRGDDGAGVADGAVGDGPVAADPRGCVAVVVTTLRQGFVLVGDDGAGGPGGDAELGRGILNSDRRGASQLDRVRTVQGLYARTGHWPAPELTLPKLLHLAEREPQRWAATRHVLFVHDWLVWRLTGERVTELSYACAGQLADVAARTWATELLDELGLRTGRFAPLVEAGTPVGRLREPFRGVPAGTPVVAGCGDTQLAAVSAGGLADGVVTVVAGSSTPVQAATAEPLRDPLEHPWVSTHARRDLWAAETNCGYPGTMQGWLDQLLGGGVRPSGEPGAGGLVAVTGSPAWTAQGWATKAPMGVLGLRPDTTPGDLAQAFLEAHLASVRANVEDLERGLGRPAAEVVLAGGASGLAPDIADHLADALSRPVRVGPSDAADGAWWLVTGELPARTGRCRPERGTTEGGPTERRVVEPREPGRYDASHARYLDAWAGLRERFPEEDA